MQKYHKWILWEFIYNYISNENFSCVSQKISCIGSYCPGWRQAAGGVYRKNDQLGRGVEEAIKKKMDKKEASAAAEENLSHSSVGSLSHRFPFLSFCSFSESVLRDQKSRFPPAQQPALLPSQKTRGGALQI